MTSGILLNGLSIEKKDFWISEQTAGNKLRL
jgi:hypothetical protein